MQCEAFKLAQYLLAGLLKAVYHGSAPAQTLKQLAHIYDSITADTTRRMNRIKPLYTSRGVGCSGRGVYYSRNRKLWLGKLTEEGHRLRAEFLYKQLDHLRPLTRGAKKALLKQAARESAFKRPQGVPGLGPIRVAQVIAAVGSPHRFRTKRQFRAYCGLAVVTRPSADYEVVESSLRRGTQSTRTRGLKREYSRRQKRVFESAALEALKEDSIKRKIL